MSMTAKESKAVAWLCEAGDGKNVDATPREFVRDDYKRFGRTIIPLVPESLLHAAEAERDAYAEQAAALRDSSSYYQKRLDKAEAALGELLRRVGELEAGIREHRDTFPDEALPTELKLWSLIASDGGADGDSRP